MKRLPAGLRLLSVLDGASYLLLLGVAMPLKYLAGYSMAVSVVGAIHGGLFVGLCLALVLAVSGHRLSGSRCLVVFLCALFPFAPFFLDRHLKTWLGEPR